jgi:hypothetical protein
MKYIFDTNRPIDNMDVHVISKESGIVIKLYKKDVTSTTKKNTGRILLTLLVQKSEKEKVLFSNLFSIE